MVKGVKRREKGGGGAGKEREKETWGWDLPTYLPPYKCINLPRFKKMTR